jgi:hypothetical protein
MKKNEVLSMWNRYDQRELRERGISSLHMAFAQPIIRNNFLHVMHHLGPVVASNIDAHTAMQRQNLDAEFARHLSTAQVSGNVTFITNSDKIHECCTLLLKFIEAEFRYAFCREGFERALAELNVSN